MGNESPGTAGGGKNIQNKSVTCAHIIKSTYIIIAKNRRLTPVRFGGLTSGTKLFSRHSNLSSYRTHPDGLVFEIPRQ